MILWLRCSSWPPTRRIIGIENMPMRRRLGHLWSPLLFRCLPKKRIGIPGGQWWSSYFSTASAPALSIFCLTFRSCILCKNTMSRWQRTMNFRNFRSWNWFGQEDQWWWCRTRMLGDRRDRSWIQWGGEWWRRLMACTDWWTGPWPPTWHPGHTCCSLWGSGGKTPADLCHWAASAHRNSPTVRWWWVALNH